MNTALHAPLTSLESSLNSLIHAFTSTPTAASAPTSLASLLNADDALSSALSTLWTHQKNHARILELQTEADGLEDRIKELVRRCGEVRGEALGILGDEFEDDDEEDEVEEEKEKEEEGGQEEIDYRTLLGFAQRISRFNAEAAREATELSERRKAEARRRREGEGAAAGKQGTAQQQSQQQENGLNGAAMTQAQGQGQMNTAEAHGLLGKEGWLHEATVWRDWNSGQPWPMPERLRMGVLGQLQVARESGGEEGVWREVERLEGDARGGKGGAEQQEDRGEVLKSPTRERGQAVARPVQNPERKKSVTLDLDLYNEDEDEDGDE
ncbi:MAG: hypothetical protein Q9227_005594 [Pyrenula ochraceoflavens]